MTTWKLDPHTAVIRAQDPASFHATETRLWADTLQDARQLAQLAINGHWHMPGYTIVSAKIERMDWDRTPHTTVVETII